MKGLLKGLRYISQIFDEEKEQEMKIGFPTDVKHVAHIGWDGPSVDSPSWMKEFKAPGAFQSAPLSANGGDPIENPEIKWVSEDKNRRSTRSEGEPARDRDRDLPEVPRSRRHASSENIVAESLGKEGSGSTRSRQSRKSKGSDGSKSSRQPQDPSVLPESPSKKMPHIPKKSRRKKSKEESVTVGGGSTRSSRSKCHTSPFMDPDPDNGSDNNKELTSSSKPFVNEEGKGSR